ARQACAVPDASAQLQSADIGLSTTGVAGPDVDPQSGQPPGTVWIGVSSRLGERATRLNINGNRAEIRAQAVEAALREFAHEIENLSQGDSHSANAQEYSDKRSGYSQ
ncbi:MAG: CinA family protein, partial [Leucobacter sp.]|nr:CinA family protein [Leucobacter sp.]